MFVFSVQGEGGFVIFVLSGEVGPGYFVTGGASGKEKGVFFLYGGALGRKWAVLLSLEALLGSGQQCCPCWVL